ncbi:fibronectin type III domain-containing protein [Thermonema sp.]|uniref:fibronectin type III domain-containing protein n=1 Tax=Thermonema sp. TaxID=2231181 RepID=UPI002589D708|nr:hypothetical protein [Thermonema sp.]
MTKTPLLPKPLEAWESIVAQDSIALVAAQAIYGETFEIESRQNSIAAFINASREQENRYSFALFAADISWTTALASGLAMEDPTGVKGERYLYKIYPALPSSSSMQYYIDTAYVYLGLEEVFEVNGIRDISVSFSDHSAILKWPYRAYEGLFTAYIVERSDDGQHFERITPLPIIMPTRNSKGDGFIYWQDSIPANNKEYYYRVRGITPFGELSPPSKTVSGSGFKPLDGTPYITQAFSPDNQSVNIKWSFPLEAEKTVGHFLVEQAEKIEGPFKSISPPLGPQTRQYTIKESPEAAYYRVKAIGKEEGFSHSLPVLVQLIDSIPPAPPTGLQGFIDSTGVVHIQWQPNKESDIYGYRVYRANGPHEEFSQVTKQPLKEPFFTDTIVLKTLTKNVYYKVVALDRRFTPSEFSEVLVLKRPDKVPPATPVFYERKNTDKGPVLKWHPATDKDIAYQVLYRKERYSNRWTSIAKLPAQIGIYQDTSAKMGIEYWYTMVSVDSSYLESRPAQPISGKKIDSKERPGFKEVQIIADRENRRIIIEWEYEFTSNNPLLKVESFIIYRSINDKPLEQFTKVGSNKQQYIDRESLVSGRKYNYRIKAVFTDGTESPLSELQAVVW